MQPQLEGPRPARPGERTAVLELVNSVFRTAAGKEPTIESDWPHVYDTGNLENVLVIADQGRLVASTGVWPNDIRLGNVTLRAGGINCVGTLPEYRRLGLGGRLMQAAQAHMAHLGCHVGLLSTDIFNWYRAFGWERAGIVHTYRFDRANIGLLPCLPAAVRQRSAGEDEAALLCDLHNAGCLGGIRTPSLMRRLLVRRPFRAFVAERNGRPSAYVLLRDDRVFEWGGDAAEVAGLIRACFEAADNPTASTSTRAVDGQAHNFQLRVVAPAAGHPLTSLLAQTRVPLQVDYAGMLYVVDPAALLAAFGCDSIQVRADGDLFEIAAEDGRARLSRSQLAKLFFGPEQVTPLGQNVSPLPFWQWELERV